MFRRFDFRKYKEILGINRRNQVYIRPHNHAKAKRIADNKILTKRLLNKHNISTPELYKVVRTKKQLMYMDWASLPKSFVIKPNRGSTGSGILVIYGRAKDKLEWIRSTGARLNQYDLEVHMLNILEGRYSMGNRSDMVLIEERVKNHPVIKPYAYKGIPDVRVVVYNQVPVMAYIRIPTRRSAGKANLNAGGLAVGIDISSGLTTNAIRTVPLSFMEYDYEIVETTADFAQNLPLRGIQIPFFNKILRIALQAQQISGLGFMAVDIAIDRDRGPLVFEINARPGPAIQIANMAGLRSRLERVEGLKVRDIDHGIRIAKNLFGGEVEDEIASISGKTIVRLTERAVVYHVGRTKNSKKYEVIRVSFNPSYRTSRIDQGLASRIGFRNAIKHFKSFDIPDRFDSLSDAQQFIDTQGEEIVAHEQIERLARVQVGDKYMISPVLPVPIKLPDGKKTIDMIVSSQSVLKYPAVIGRNEMKSYLLDTGRTF